MVEPTPADSVPFGVRKAVPFPLAPILLLVSIFFLDLAARVTLSPLLPVLEHELGLTHGEAGSLFLLIQIGYCIGLLGSGFASCWLSHRRTILLSTTALGVVLLVMSRSSSLAGLRVGLLLLGTSAGLYLPAGIATITRDMSKRDEGNAAGASAADRAPDRAGSLRIPRSAWPIYSVEYAQ